jgi:hypothetical protein
MDQMLDALCALPEDMPRTPVITKEDSSTPPADRVGGQQFFDS